VYNKAIPKQKSKMSQRSTASLYYSLISFTLILGVFSVSGLAQSSANYILGGGLENGGGQSISGNFIQNCNQISGGAIGQGSSSNYSITSGVACENGSVNFDFRAALEKRIPIAGYNLAQDQVKISLFAVGNQTPVHTSTNALSLDSNGNSTSQVSAPISAGQYDISIKTSQHLSERTNNVTLTNNSNMIDLSNSLTNFLRAGDVNNTGGLGDDTVNALDISREINQLGSGDGQTDLNRDSKVNALDIGILLKNLGQHGD
jgi:hypothetical protein